MQMSERARSSSRTSVRDQLKRAGVIPAAVEPDAERGLLVTADAAATNECSTAFATGSQKVQEPTQKRRAGFDALLWVGFSALGEAPDSGTREDRLTLLE